MITELHANNRIGEKVRQYFKLIKKVRNWPAYLVFKSGGTKGPFNIKLTNGIQLTATRRSLGPFKECMLQEVCMHKMSPIENANPVIIDIGANMGFFSLSVSLKYPNAKIYAIEPMPFCHQSLNRLKDHIPHLHVSESAISDKQGELILYLEREGGFTTMASMYKKEKDKFTHKVRSVRLEDYLNENDISYIDLLKLDCEGAEYPILFNLSDNVFERLDQIVCETHHVPIEEYNMWNLSELIQSKGFDVKCQTTHIGGYIWAKKNH